MNIDKEKFMAFVSKAFESDTKIDIMFYADENTEEAAQELAEEFSEIVSKEVEEIYSQDLTCRWFRVYGDHTVSVWHQNSHDKKYLKRLANDEEVKA